MKIEILDTKIEEKSVCYLARAVIRDYLDALPEDFASFHIQRDRTNNVYLDRLIDTVIRRRHIPTLVLIADSVNTTKSIAYNLKILDGLQRTLRLKAIADSIEIARSLNLKLTRPQIIRQVSALLSEKGIDAATFFQVVDAVNANGFDELDACLQETQWFEIWTNLSDEDQVRKMLLLNAGHKAVKTRHQLELLFLGVLPRLESQKNGKFVVVREKESSSISFSKKRTTGEFHFAAVIASLVAYFLGKTVTTNAELVSDLQNDDSENSIRRIIEGFSYKFTSLLTGLLVDLDTLIEEKEGSLGIQWLGREVVLVGIFAALGDFARDSTKGSPEKAFSLLLGKVRTTDLDLIGFEQLRNDQDLGKINIGAVNKRAVFLAVRDLLSDQIGSQVIWGQYFGGQ